MKRGNLHLLTLLLTLGSFIPSSATAQLTPDNTLGAENSIVTPDATRQLIQGGATRGNNLFHSFTDFNVGENQRVYFANPTDITNILTRVTGNNLSNILGTLGVDGTANLFLLNPNGIIFGSNAQLDIRGSFVATTADSILFDNNVTFSARDPQAPPLLTINVPIGLQYGSNSTATISNRGNLSAGGNLKLGAANLDLQGQLQAGGDLTLQATDTLTIRDSETSPFIAAANGQLLVQGNEKVDIFALNHPDSGLYSGGDIVLRSAKAVGGDAHYWSGGNFRIEDLQGNLGDLYSPYDPIVRSTGDVEIGTYKGASLHVLAGGQINIKDVTITDKDSTGNAISPQSYPKLAAVTLSDGTTITIDGVRQPTLDLRAGMNLTNVGQPMGRTGENYITISGFAYLDTVTNADINLGQVKIEAPNSNIFISNNYKANNSWSGNINLYSIGGIGIQLKDDIGNPASIVLDSRGDINIQGTIQTSSTNSNSGNVTLLANRNIEIDRNIITRSELGRPGDITARAYTGSITLQNGAELRSRTEGSFKAGDITLSSQSLIVRDGAGIYSNATSSGDAGKIEINAAGSVEFDRGNLFINNSGGTGNAGTLIVNAENFTAQNGSILSAASQGTGVGGNVTLNVRDRVYFLGNDSVDLSPQTKLRPTILTMGSFGSGAAGNLSIDARQLVVENGALIYGSANQASGGNAANISVKASDSIQILGTTPNGQLSSNLASDTFGQGNAGNLSITTPYLVVRDGGRISAGTTGTGRAGTLSVNDAKLVEVTGTSRNGQRQSQLLFDSFGSGDAGELKINTQRLLVSNGGQILGQTGGSGRGGIIDVNATESINISGSSGNLASTLSFDSNGSGNARGIRLQTPGDLTVENGGKITVSGTGAGVSGDIDITARNIFLTNQGQLSASTRAAQGGNIRLQVSKNLILRYNSEITAEAFGASTGGNINMDVGGVISAVLSENSDIVASSESGQGGKIYSDAPALGFRQYNGHRTPESDFTAISEQGGPDLSGTAIVTRNVPPLVELPNRFAPPPLNEGCDGGQTKENSRSRRGEFYIPGRGGLPPHPRDMLGSTTVEIPWLISEENEPTASSPELVEATGWEKLPDGRRFLIGSDDEKLGNLPLACRSREEESKSR